jgi:hypothetical protein
VITVVADTSPKARRTVGILAITPLPDTVMAVVV